jgi:hypothetical protein
LLDWHGEQLNEFQQSRNPRSNALAVDRFMDLDDLIFNRIAAMKSFS